MSSRFKDNPESVNTFRKFNQRLTSRRPPRRNRPQASDAAHPSQGDASQLPSYPTADVSDAVNERASQGGSPRSLQSSGAPSEVKGTHSVPSTSVGHPRPVHSSDILSRGCFQLEGLGFHQLLVSDRISPEMLGLNSLIDSIYLKLTSSGSYFSKFISKSVFSYYCCTFAYARLLQLSHNSKDELTADERSFVDFINKSSFLVPEPLLLYLAAFGSTSLNSGTKLRFRMAPHRYEEANRIPGFFGRVSANTHYLYAAYPCLAVCVCRIFADMARTPEGIPYWDLPLAIRPMAVWHRGLGYPTENMVGYGPAVYLKSSQRSWLENLGVVDGVNRVFPTINNTLPLHPELLEAVSNGLKECRAYAARPYTADEVFGSQAQATMVRIDPNTVVPVRLPFLHCGLELQSPDQYPAVLASAGLLFCFRARRTALHTADGNVVNNWCVYECHNYTRVPVAWQLTANALGAEDNPYLGVMMFETDNVSRARYLQAWGMKMAEFSAKSSADGSAQGKP